MSESIFTQRLELVCCTMPIIEAILEGDEAISSYLSVTPAQNWTEFGAPAFEYTANLLKSQPEATKWLCYLPVVLPKRILIGSGGYKGPVDDEGVIEIGYEIAEGYRNNGMATEMVRGLINHAFNLPEIKIVQAHTLANNNPSCSVLKKCGFQFIDELIDPEDGCIWLWQLKRHG